MFKIWGNEISHSLCLKWEQRYCKLPVSFLTVKLKLGPNFSQFIHTFKYNYEYNLNIGLSVGLMLYFQILPNSRKRSLYFQIVTNSLRSWEIRSLKSPWFLFIRSQIIWSLKLAKTFSQQSMAKFIPMLLNLFPCFKYSLFKKIGSSINRSIKTL